MVIGGPYLERLGLVAAQDPTLWVHPFGPLTRNVPILIGTGVSLCRPWSPSR